MLIVRIYLRILSIAFIDVIEDILIFHKKVWREESGHVIARQPDLQGAKARIHEANDGKRIHQTASWAAFRL